jgi:hypothetical protein
VKFKRAMLIYQVNINSELPVFRHLASTGN